jgi:hypothetical protein
VQTLSQKSSEASHKKSSITQKREKTMSTYIDPISRMTVYLGPSDKAKIIKDRIKSHLAVDVRFRGSPMNFARYAILYTLDNDPSLKREPKAA